jgi:hypothetical protein
MAKQIQNLILKHGVEKLHTMIDQTYAEMQDWKKLNKLLESRETARDLFEQYCRDNNHTFIECYKDKDYNKHGKSCLALNGWRSSTPYVYLWLNRDSKPHFELSSTDVYAIESYFGYNDLTKKIAKIVELHKETA